MFGDYIRRTGFWVLDFLKGGKIYNNYKDIKNRNDSCIPNKPQLDLLLNHATKTVPFYKNYDSNDINKFPVIDKNIIKSQWEELHSDVYKGKPVHYMSTSGSTGTPFTMEWDMGKRKRQLADLIYYKDGVSILFMILSVIF